MSTRTHTQRHTGTPTHVAELKTHTYTRIHTHSHRQELEENGYQIVLRGTNSSNNNNNSSGVRARASFLYMVLRWADAHHTKCTHTAMCACVYGELHCTCVCVWVCKLRVCLWGTRVLSAGWRRGALFPRSSRMHARSCVVWSGDVLDVAWLRQE